MQLITNRIHTGKAASFADFIKKFQEKKQIKTASVKEEATKVAEQEEAESSGQLYVEPLHQDGESTEMPKKGPKAKKESKEHKEKEVEASKSSDEEGRDSGAGKWEGEQKNNNDPEEPVEKGGESKGEKKTKEAALEDLPQEVQDKIKGKNKEEGKEEEEEEEEKKAEQKKTSKFVRVSNLSDNQKAIMAVKLAKNVIDTLGPDHTKKYISNILGTIKEANLDEKNKNFLKEYWRQLFNEEYCDALVADK